MGIILPLVAPLAKQIGGDDPNFLTHCIASVLGASTFGNLCSPISDTTILTGASAASQTSQTLQAIELLCDCFACTPTP
jgi:Na+/H+ antiporter NhaC